MKTKRKGLRRWTLGILACFQAAGLILGGLVIYAKDHPGGKLHEVFTRAGFHIE